MTGRNEVIDQAVKKMNGEELRAFLEGFADPKPSEWSDEVRAKFLLQLSRELEDRGFDVGTPDKPAKLESVWRRLEKRIQDRLLAMAKAGEPLPCSKGKCPDCRKALKKQLKSELAELGVAPRKRGSRR
jgi:hypothetical protein